LAALLVVEKIERKQSEMHHSPTTKVTGQNEVPPTVYALPMRAGFSIDLYFALNPAVTIRQILLSVLFPE
jgi:hypothetical protein